VVADVLTMLTWSLFLLAGVMISTHLLRHMGVLVASQASVMSLAALCDVLMLKQGMNPLLSWLLAVIVVGGLGVLHVPILLQTKPALLLVLTAISQIVLVEVWYAFPQLTGGSGGVILPPVGSGWALATLVALMVAAAMYLLRFVAAPERAVGWACVRTLGPKAQAFGIPAIRHYAVGFAAYGILLAAAGVAATRHLGYLTVNSFGLGWSLATVMIVLAATNWPIVGTVGLCLFYSAIRVLLRQSIHASVTASAAFEILFPVILLLLISVDRRRRARAAYTVKPSSQEA
jgi:ABC-type branched-subunit amino acid transport system permease subunit